MDDRSFATYSTFFIEASTICRAVQEAKWRDAAARLIGSLHETSSEAVERLAELVERQSLLRDIVDAQYVSVKEAGFALDGLVEQVKEHHEYVSVAHQSLREGLATLRSDLLAMHGVIFYTFAAVGGFFVTAMQKTHRARPLVLGGLLVTGLLERRVLGRGTALPFFHLLATWGFSTPDSIWFIRRLWLGFSIVVLGWAIARWRDPVVELRRSVDALMDLQLDMLVLIRQLVHDQKRPRLTPIEMTPARKSVTNDDITPRRSARQKGRIAKRV